MVAAEYPFLDIFWTMILVFAFLIWIWLAITVFTDIFRRRDASGWKKAAWIVFIILLPYVGVLSYLVINHDEMAERNLAQAKAAQAQLDEYVQSRATQQSPAEQIRHAKDLLDAGTISQAEFDTLKAKALGT